MIAAKRKRTMRIIVMMGEYGIEYSGFLSPFFFACLAISRMRIEARPPEIIPPMPKIFIKFALF